MSGTLSDEYLLSACYLPRSSIVVLISFAWSLWYTLFSFQNQSLWGYVVQVNKVTQLVSGGTASWGSSAGPSGWKPSPPLLRSSLPHDLLMISNKFANIQSSASRISSQKKIFPIYREVETIFSFLSYKSWDNTLTSQLLLYLKLLYFKACWGLWGRSLFYRTIIIVVLKLNILLEQLNK